VTEYLSVEQVRALHHALVRAFGAAGALRDRGALEAAVARPAMTFGGEDLCPDLASKGAALMHSLMLNYPFVDGNKRVGVAAAEFFFACNRHSLEASDEELEALTLDVAKGEVQVEALAIWFRQRLTAEQNL
jgi:death on curing protein